MASIPIQHQPQTCTRPMTSAACPPAMVMHGVCACTSGYAHICALFPRPRPPIWPVVRTAGQKRREWKVRCFFEDECRKPAGRTRGGESKQVASTGWKTRTGRWRANHTVLDRETCQIKIAAPCRRRLPCRVSVFLVHFSLFALNMTRTYAQLCGVFGTGQPTLVVCGMGGGKDWAGLDWTCLPCPAGRCGRRLHRRRAGGRWMLLLLLPDKEGRQLRWGLGDVPLEGRHSSVSFTLSHAPFICSVGSLQFTVSIR